MRHVFFLLLIIGQCQAGFWGTSPPPSEKAQKIQKVMGEFEPVIQKALADFLVPGLSLGIISEGQIVYSRGFGSRDMEKKLPATADTVYAIGSCTKAFTAFLAATLIDEGFFSWDSRMIDIWPEFRLLDSYATLNATLRDLMSHRTGMAAHDLAWHNSSSLTRKELMYRLRYLEPLYDLRERYEYTNLMFLAAGFVMEQRMGQSWEDMVSERILKPLSMKRTFFHNNQVQKVSDFAFPYIERQEGLKKMSFADISLIGPGGAMHSTVTDLSKWVQMHLNGGIVGQKRLVSSYNLQEMHLPLMVISDVPQTKEASILTAGLGWKVLSYRGHYYVSHDGGVGGFTSVVGFFPKDDLGIVVLANKNITTLPRYLSNQVIDKLLDLPFFDWLQEGVDGVLRNRKAQTEAKQREDLTRKKGTSPSRPLKEFTGDYENEGYGVLSIEEKNGQLVASINDLECLLDHWHYDVFVISKELQDMFKSREGAKLIFQTGSSGSVERVLAPFEPTVSDIVFCRKQSASPSKETYFKRFVGEYEVHGYTVSVFLREGILCATTPGHPVDELVEVGENTFSLKSNSWYTVRFILDENFKVKKAELSNSILSFDGYLKKA